MMIQFLKDKEETIRNEQRNQIKILKFRLGDMQTIREGTRYVNKWNDSSLIKSIKKKLVWD
jgi:hypothetical protein